QSDSMHEINEVLGIGGNATTLYLDGPYSGQPPPTDGVGPLDFHRYSSPGVRSFSLDPNLAAYFSIDGGNKRLVSFNQYANKSDYGDWGNGVVPAQNKPNSSPQMQDAFDSKGSAPDLGANELIALDVIGYTLLEN